MCISEYYGGWWYVWVVYFIGVNLNGIYYLMKLLEKIGIFWFYFDGYFIFKEVKMMI